MLSEIHDQLDQHYMHLDAAAETLKEYLSWLQEKGRVNTRCQVQFIVHSKKSNVCKESGAKRVRTRLHCRTSSLTMTGRRDTRVVSQTIGGTKQRPSTTA